MTAWEKFKKLVAVESLVEPGDRILVGFSGGPDSVCLLHMLWRLKKTVPMSLYIAHFDHGLRKQSVKDRQFVEKIGSDLGIEVCVKRIPVGTFSGEENVSIETAGRVLRYREFENIAREFKCNKIATGHNANDNAETVLFWLVRGTGTDGLKGIPSIRSTECGYKVIRPILSLTRQEIMDYLKSQKLKFRTDKTNKDTTFTRNRLRHELIPVMMKYNKKFIEHIYNLSKIIANEHAYLDLTVQKALKRFLKRSKRQISFDLSAFFKYNDTVQLRLLRKILPEKCSHLHINRVIDWLRNSKQISMPFSRSWILKKTSKKFIFLKR